MVINDDIHGWNNNYNDLIEDQTKIIISIRSNMGFISRSRSGQ